MMNKTVNQVKPAYTHYLEKEMRKIKRVARTEDKTQLVSFISTIIRPAAATYVNAKGTRLPTKKKRFLATINSKAMDNEHIVCFCENSINKARRTKAKYNNLATE